MWWEACNSTLEMCILSCRGRLEIASVRVSRCECRCANIIEKKCLFRNASRKWKFIQFDPGTWLLWYRQELFVTSRVDVALSYRAWYLLRAVWSDLNVILSVSRSRLAQWKSVKNALSDTDWWKLMAAKTFLGASVLTLSKIFLRNWELPVMWVSS